MATKTLLNLDTSGRFSVAAYASDSEAWLRDRGWAPDRNAWRLMTGRRVRIYSFGEACKFQRRSDRSKGFPSPPATPTPGGKPPT